MKAETIKLSQIKVNRENPRTITTDKFNKLVDSILVFPKMLELRPIVIDKSFKALGGNMRTQALNAISKMSIDSIKVRLSGNMDYTKKTEAEQNVLVDHWSKWLADPTALIVKADSLTKAEQEQFVIKDNVAFGAWDYDALSSKFDNAQLGGWGMDVWQMPNVDPLNFGGASVASPAPSVPDASEDDGNGTTSFEGQLPPELQGQDLLPADLPDIQGSDQTLMERVIIVFPKERSLEVAAMLGLEQIEKVIYRIDELNGDI